VEAQANFDENDGIIDEQNKYCTYQKITESSGTEYMTRLGKSGTTV
jgi:hypothetical protein